MRLEHYSDQKLKIQIVEIVGKYLDLKKFRIFFFGSRVQGNSSERSDIDIGIEGPERIALNIMAEFKDDVESLSILYKFDVLDFGTVSPEFRDFAMRDVEYVN